MNVSIIGRHLDVGDALRSHVEEHLDGAVTKYFSQALEATVTFSKAAHRQFRADITVRPGRGMVVQGTGEAGEPYAAFDGALGRIAKQLRRYKRRLRDDHHKGPGISDLAPAQQYILASESDEDELLENAGPAVIAEMPTEIATLTVGEAVMRMDLGDLSAMVFHNRAHGELNVIYRRSDGNIGWIDPSNKPVDRG